MLNHSIIGESRGFGISGIPEWAISGLNHVGARFNPEPHARASGCGGNPSGISSIKGLVENPAGFFDFVFYGPLYISITSLLTFLPLALTIRFYS